MLDDYIRLVSFIIVFMTSLLSIRPARYSSPIYAGSILISMYLAIGTMMVRIGNFDGKILLFPYTITAVIWAALHLHAFMKR